MPNEVFQGIILMLKRGISTKMGIISQTDGTIIACSDKTQMGHKAPSKIMHYFSSKTSEDENYTYIKIFYNEDVYLFFMESHDKALVYVTAMHFNHAHIKILPQNSLYTLIGDILLNNISEDEIMIRQKNLNLSKKTKWKMLTISFYKPYRDEMLAAIKAECTYGKEFLIKITNMKVVIVLSSVTREFEEDMQVRIEYFCNFLQNIENAKCAICISLLCSSLSELHLYFKESLQSLHVKNIFHPKKYIIEERYMGVAKLISELSEEASRHFLALGFRQRIVDELDIELRETIECFYENDLNISATARKLFIHRNTMVYRLERIKELMGLDLCKFEDAVIFKLGSMMKKNMYTKRKKSIDGALVSDE